MVAIIVTLSLPRGQQEKLTLPLRDNRLDTRVRLREKVADGQRASGTVGQMQSLNSVTGSVAPLKKIALHI